jgi:hypothetical protein
MGKPFRNAACQYIGAYPIKSGQILDLQLPWIPKENESEAYASILCNYNFANNSLLAAVYSTSLDLHFTFQSMDRAFEKSLQKEIIFTIK